MTAGALDALGVTRRNLVASVLAVTVLSLAWLPATRRWTARAHRCWVSSFLLFLAYLGFMLQWSFDSGRSAPSEAGGTVLWVLEVFAALLACAYLWELCDALGSQRWRRRIRGGVTAQAIDEAALPFVSLHVPAHNEPPEMVIKTPSTG